MSQGHHQHNLRSQQLAVAVGVMLLLLKFAAYFVTHSTTILTDALEGIVNILAGVFSLYSIYLSAQPKDENHPYGHGKVEFISTGFEGIMILMAALVISLKAIINFFRPVELQQLDTGALLIFVSGLVNFAVGYYLVKQGKKNHSFALVADGKHLQTDAYTSVAVLVGVVLIYLTGWIILDNVLALIAACIMGFIGFKLVRKSLVGIMDESDVEIITPIVAHLQANRKDSWVDVHNLRVIQYGSTLHLDCHLTLPWYWNLEEVHSQIDEVQEMMNKFYPTAVEVFIHPDPCVSSSCSLCALHDCTHRKETFIKQLPWTVANVVSNKKHKPVAKGS